MSFNIFYIEKLRRNIKALGIIPDVYELYYCKKNKTAISHRS